MAAPVAKPKKTKPKGPKRPRNALIFYSRANRKRICTKNPSLSFGKINSLVAKMWKEASDEVKKPFLKEAELDRARYYREVEALKQLNLATILAERTMAS